MKKIYNDDFFRTEDVLYLRNIVLLHDKNISYEDENITLVKDTDYLNIYLNNGKSIEITSRYNNHSYQKEGYYLYFDKESFPTLRYSLMFINDEYYGEITKVLIDDNNYYIIDKDDLSEVRICDREFNKVITITNNKMRINIKSGRKRHYIENYDFSKEEDLLRYREDSFAQKYISLYNKMKDDLNNIMFSNDEMDYAIDTINNVLKLDDVQFDKELIRKK